MKVLVVDDDEDQLALRCLILARNGFEILQAQDATKALQLSRAAKPDCAVVDLLLPTEDAGSALLRDLRALYPAMRLVVLTGMPRNSVAARLQGTADEIVEKSSGTATLVRSLRP